MVKKSIKLKELFEGVGTASNVRKSTVATVMTEAFRLIREALERGERVNIPGFGTFVVRGGEDGQPKMIRFRPGDWSGGPGPVEGPEQAPEQAQEQAAPAPPKPEPPKPKAAKAKAKAN